MSLESEGIRLADLGWNAHFDSHRGRLAPHHVPGRVASEQRGRHLVLGERGPRHARIGGRLGHAAVSRADLPAVGDWVGLRLPPGEGDAVIETVLPRLSCFSRKEAGRGSDSQVIAANVDVVVLVTSANEDFNLRRLERQRAVAEASGASVLILLNKVDLAEDPGAFTAELASVMGDVPVVAASALHGRGLDGLRARLRPGLTFALVGTSGVGKSTTVNALLGAEVQATGAVREHDARGRHVTTHRELFLLPGGGLLLDTPGMRELSGTIDDGASVGGFADVDALAERCRFRDCGHASEPGCAVRQALGSGELDEGRLASWRKLQKELAYEARRHDVGLMLAERRRWKAITKSVRTRTKGR